ncbi:MAG: winged helix-turn-helix transcriptional regulator [Lachnospiraceae bacterium]|nr:winged helix-turn-helix transcriptional regulator [Lachnospiraceae bacterium]
MTKITLPHDHGQNVERVLRKMPDQEACVRTAEIFKQVSDGSRLRILWFLCHCEECVSNIAAAMEMSDPAVSHHLRLLKKSGLIVSRRDGKETYYRLADTDKAGLLHRVCEEMFEISCPSEQ